jgi:hypothetical protein
LGPKFTVITSPVAWMSSGVRSTVGIGFGMRDPL